MDGDIYQHLGCSGNFMFLAQLPCSTAVLIQSVACEQVTRGRHTLCCALGVVPLPHTQDWKPNIKLLYGQHRACRPMGDVKQNRIGSHPATVVTQTHSPKPELPATVEGRSLAYTNTML